MSRKAGTAVVIGAIALLALVVAVVVGIRLFSRSSSSHDAEDQNSPAGAATRFLRAPYAERYRYVCNGEKLQKDMERFYADYPKPKGMTLTVDRTEDLRPEAALVHVTAFNGRNELKLRCYVRQIDNQWLVDWKASTGQNPVGVQELQANPPQEPVNLRFRVEVSGEYKHRYEFARDTHYCFRLIDPVRTVDFLTGFVPKASDLGKQLNEILVDGNGHDLFLSVSSIGNGQMDIVGLVSADWLGE